MLYKQYRAMLAGEYAATPRQFYTGNASMPREQFLASGGFDTKLRRAEDLELGYRLEADGLDFTFNPAAIGVHFANRSSWLSIAYDYGLVDARLMRDHDRRAVVDIVHAGYRSRGWTSRAVLRACTANRHLASTFSWVLATLVRAGDQIGLRWNLRPLLSALHAIRYYRGLADELGPELFEAVVLAPAVAGARDAPRRAAGRALT
jgi:GT2 family glycosyltransferase